jgi:hypothetical protein
MLYFLAVLFSGLYSVLLTLQLWMRRSTEPAPFNSTTGARLTTRSRALQERRVLEAQLSQSTKERERLQASSARLQARLRSAECRVTQLEQEREQLLKTIDSLCTSSSALQKLAGDLDVARGVLGKEGSVRHPLALVRREPLRSVRPDARRLSTVGEGSSVLSLDSQGSLMRSFSSLGSSHDTGRSSSRLSAGSDYHEAPMRQSQLTRGGGGLDAFELDEVAAV